MSVVNTEGIILKRSNLNEADRLLTVITPFKGKIKVLAKGVRKINSRRGGSIELLNQVRMTLYKGKSLYNLTEVECIDSFIKIKSNLILTTYASHLTEIIDKLIPEEQLNINVYRNFLSAIKLLEKNPRKIYIRAFEIKLLSELGFWSVIELKTDSKVTDLLISLERKSFSEIENIIINDDLGMEVENILRYYIEKVIEGPLRSLNLINKLK